MYLAVGMLMLLHVIMALTSILLLYKKQFDISAILSLLYVVFYAFPAWDFVMEWGLFNKQLLDYNLTIPTSTYGLKLIFLTTLIMLVFMIGYNLVRVNWFTNSNYFEYTILKSKFKILTSVLIGVWLVTLFIGFMNFKENYNNILLFFSPSRKEGIFDSAYIESLYTLIPNLLVVLFVLKDRFTKRKLSVFTLFLILLSFLAYFTTGQRRETINFLIFLFIFMSHIKIKQNLAWYVKSRLKRKKIYSIGVTALVMIPIMWWGRSLFTQIQRGSEITAPWELRGFLELIFASPATGFKTLLLIQDYLSNFSIPWGYSVKFLIFSAIPRSMMSDKPSVVPELIEAKMNLPGNPSFFYVNEMIVNFGCIAILLSLIFGAIVGFFYKKYYYSNDYLQNVYSFVIFSNLITLFKNGFTPFIISCTFTIVITSLCLRIVFTKKILEMQENE